MKAIISGILFCLSFIAMDIPCMAAEADLPDWEQLMGDVAARKETLSRLISKAEAAGLATDYARTSETVITLFQQASTADRDTIDKVRRIFGSFNYPKKVDTDLWANRLATDELLACLEVAGYAIDQLRLQLDGELVLAPTPDFSTGRMELGEASYLLDGYPVFPYSLVWMPAREPYLSGFGRLGGISLRMQQIPEDLASITRPFEVSASELKQQAAENCAPFSILTGHVAPGWLVKRHPEIVHWGRNFTRYDTDSPLVREWISTLYRAALPIYSDAVGGQPMIHLVANEPHFATARGGWLARNGLSDNTMARYAAWLENKYRTIHGLNAIYGTRFEDFSSVRFYETPDPGGLDVESHTLRQIDPGLRGTAIWYDWCRFNMDRINDCFTFLKSEAKANDGGRRAPMSIKMLGHSLSRETRDGGMDVEYLVKLQDVVGADLRVTPLGAEFYGKHEEGLDPKTGWIARSSYDWVDQSMFIDFAKSICPDKVFYDSEWHGFGTVSWRHFSIGRDYVRSALWMAFTHGMGLINPWLWGRSENGELDNRADHLGQLSTQPIAMDAYGRVMKELNAHAKRILPAVPEHRRFMIYYCEESAIQDEVYTNRLKDVYESLKLLNLKVGFTTPSEIGSLDTATQVLILPPTRYIMDDSLDRLLHFADSGGRLVAVTAGANFIWNELGQARQSIPALGAVRTVPLAEIPDMVEDMESSLKDLRSKPIIGTRISDTDGRPAYGVFIQQYPDPACEGSVIVTLNNFSRFPRRVAIDTVSKLTDLLTGNDLPDTFTMQPCAVHLVRIH